MLAQIQKVGESYYREYTYSIFRLTISNTTYYQVIRVLRSTCIAEVLGVYSSTQDAYGRIQQEPASRRIH